MQRIQSCSWQDANHAHDSPEMYCCYCYCYCCCCGCCRGIVQVRDVTLACTLTSSFHFRIVSFLWYESLLYASRVGPLQDLGYARFHSISRLTHSAILTSSEIRTRMAEARIRAVESQDTTNEHLRALIMRTMFDRLYRKTGVRISEAKEITGRVRFA
jgi:hypothetical protein